MNVKILSAMLALALATGGVSYGTFAYFSDEETSTQNIFTGATLDMTLDNAQGVTGTIGDLSFAPGESTSGSVVVKNAGGLLSGTALDVQMIVDDLWAEQGEPTTGSGDIGDQNKRGTSVAMDGTTLVVGEPGDGGGIGAAFVFTTSDGGATWDLQQRLEASDRASGDRFGDNVDVDGDTVVVGAYLDDGTGSAYIFTRSGTTWTQQQKLTASDAAADDQFGRSVAVDGDTVVVGAQHADCPDTSSNCGAAYVFTRSGTTWTEQQILTASDAATDDALGWSVALDGDTAVVSGHGNDDGSTDTGSAYVFTRSGSTWTEQQKLVASDAAASDFFGYSVAVSGDTVVVGAFQDDGAAGSDQGSAYVFTRSGSTWSEQQKLTATDAGAGDEFGNSVDLDGDVVIVGAPGNDGDGTDRGAAYLFKTRDSGASWFEQDRLAGNGPDAGDGDDVGYAVAVAGDLAAVGAPLTNKESKPDSGRVYAYKTNAAEDLADWLVVTALNYDGSAITLPGDVDGDGLANTLSDLNDNGAFIDLSAPGSAGKTLDITVKFDESAGNDTQGLTENLTIKFKLRQAGAPSL